VPDSCPRISIVIPSFNQAAYLEAALHSIIVQQYPNVEVILIDGGSTDGSADLIANHRAVLAHAESAPDAGPADALNRGFRHATGAILGFLNADDFHLPGCLQALAGAFKARPDADVISGHGYFASATGELGAPTFSDRWNARRFAYGACVLVQPATFFKRSAFDRAGGFRKTGSVCWDMELWADMARTGARFETIDAFLAGFRLHDRSITGSVQLQERRRTDARAVMSSMRGRAPIWSDRVLEIGYRLGKFSSHPIRTFRQRLYFYSALRRWSL
jgi:glycosyltransferase involved in cell wall biosynthesis